MIKNKIPMVTTILVLAIGFIVLSTNDLTAEASKEEKIISYPGEIIKYDDLNDLEKDAPIIVQATFTGDRETVYPNITEGRLFRSDSLVEIKKVFKGDLNKKDQIVVYEPAYLDENDVFVTIDGYNCNRQVVLNTFCSLRLNTFFSENSASVFNSVAVFV
jgi:predicted glycoside hydrolase/deacetylase ChbG (UPF0249 family)